MKQKGKRELEEENPTQSEKLGKNKKKKKRNNEEAQTESMDTSDSGTRKQQKQGKKKKKKAKEILETDESKQKAVSYLNKWKHDRQSWKFEKVRQVWLLKHMLKVSKVPDSVFAILVEYLNGAKGHARQVVIDKTMDVVRIMEKCAQLSEQGMSEEEIAKQCPNRVSEQMHDRARTILQSLQEAE